MSRFKNMVKKAETNPIKILKDILKKSKPNNKNVQ